MVINAAVRFHLYIICIVYILLYALTHQISPKVNRSVINKFDGQNMYVRVQYLSVSLYHKKRGRGMKHLLRMSNLTKKKKQLAEISIMCPFCFFRCCFSNAIANKIYTDQF